MGVGYVFGTAGEIEGFGCYGGFAGCWLGKVGGEEKDDGEGEKGVRGNVDL